MRLIAGNRSPSCNRPARIKEAIWSAICCLKGFESCLDRESGSENMTGNHRMKTISPLGAARTQPIPRTTTVVSRARTNFVLGQKQ